MTTNVNHLLTTINDDRLLTIVYDDPLLTIFTKSKIAHHFFVIKDM